MSTTIAITDCSEARKTSCNDEFRSCQRIVTMTDDGFETKTTEDEFCTSCIDGYVEWDESYGVMKGGSNEQEPACINIFEDMNVDDYVQSYQPFYPNLSSKVSDDRRLELLQKAASFVAAHNRHQQLGSEEVVQREGDTDEVILALNEYSADTDDELKQRTGYIYVDLSAEKNGLSHVEASETEDEPPFSVDYVNMGAVTSVKKQGRCASSWAISLAGSIEGATFLQNKQVESFSFQQYIGCNRRNLGCDGGNLIVGMEYTRSQGGLSSLTDYPYTDYFGQETDDCLLRNDDEDIPLSVGVSQPRIVYDFHYGPFDYTARLKHVKHQLARYGPISMVIRSNCQLFTNYRSGIFTDEGDCACTTADCLDHAVLMVGYNDLAEIPYFTFKNSWGETWGERGYFRVAQTPKGEYGLFGILAHGAVAGDGVIDAKTIAAAAARGNENSSLSARWILFIVAAWLAVCLFSIIGVKHFFFPDDKLRPSPKDEQDQDETSADSPQLIITDEHAQDDDDKQNKDEENGINDKAI